MPIMRRRHVSRGLRETTNATGRGIRRRLVSPGRGGRLAHLDRLDRPASKAMSIALGQTPTQAYWPREPAQLRLALTLRDAVFGLFV
jgi:hypothetical protein